MAILMASVKTALRRAETTAFDLEIQELIDAALQDLGIAGVNAEDNVEQPLVLQAVKTYCKLNFGETDQYDHLKRAYDEQKAQLQMSSTFHDFKGA